MVALLVWDQVVGGSNPSYPTMKIKRIKIYTSDGNGIPIEVVPNDGTPIATIDDIYRCLCDPNDGFIFPSVEGKLTQIIPVRHIIRIEVTQE